MRADDFGVSQSEIWGLVVVFDSLCISVSESLW
jgi:hypothetical protein